MTLADINQRITFLTGASVTQYTYQDRTINLNKWYYNIQNLILQSQDDWNFDDLNATTLPFGTTNLVANQNDYALPSTILKLDRVEVTYDGTNWYEATPLDPAQRSDVLKSSDFAQSQPYYDVNGSSIIVYPTPATNVSNGLKIFIDRAVTAFTFSSEASNELLTGTKTPGFDIMFHDLLSLGASYEFNSAKRGDKSLYQDIQIMISDLKRHYSTKDKDTQLIMRAADVNYE